MFDSALTSASKLTFCLMADLLGSPYEETIHQLVLTRALSFSPRVQHRSPSYGKLLRDLERIVLESRRTPIRPVRPRQGRFHGGRQGAGRPDQTSRRGCAVSRRGGRAAHDASEILFAGVAGAAIPPSGSEKRGKKRFQADRRRNRDLDRMAAKGLFRKDLLYRIRTLTMELPPCATGERTSRIW